MAEDTRTLRVKVRVPAGTAEIARGEQPAAKALKQYYEYTSSPTFRVLGVPFGGHLQGRDADGEAFHPDTDIWLRAGDTVNVTYYHGFGPDEPSSWQEHPTVIGKALYTGADNHGHWFDVRLDMEEPLALRLLPDTAEVRASSGAVAHLVRMGAAGLIDVWPVGELALFDCNDWRRPANELAIVEKKKSVDEALPAETDAQAQECAQVSVVLEAEVIPDSMEEDEDIVEPDGGMEMSEETNTSPALDIQALADALRPVIVDTVKSTVENLWNEAPNTRPAGKRAPGVIKSENIGEPDEMAAFLHYMRTGERVKGLRFAKAALQEGTPAEGGVLVPDDFLPRIQEKRDAMSVVRQSIAASGGTVLRTSREKLTVPRESTKMMEFAITSEGAAADENEPTFDGMEVSIYKFTKLVKVSDELLDDDATNLEEYLARSFGRAWALTENHYAFTGTGLSQPQGALAAGTAASTFAAANAITASEVIGLYHKLAEPYQEGAVWSLRNSTLGHLRTLTGNPFQFQSTPAGNGRYLYEAPYFCTDAMGALSTAQKSMLIGNWQFFALVERAGMTVRRLNELYAATGQVGILATVRFGAGVIFPEAFQYGTQG